MDEVVPSRKACQLLGVTSHTLRRWHKEGKIEVVRPNGTKRLYRVGKFLSNGDRAVAPPVEKEKICYCRVSSAKQKDDLQRQEAFMREQYPDHTIISDIGSGINWQRKGLQSILEKGFYGKLEEVIVAHRDRLCRFAFGLFQQVFKLFNTKLVVLDDDEECSSEKELYTDVLAIIHVYACRQMGRRNYKGRKRNKNKESEDISDQQSSESTEEMVGDNTLCLQ